MRKMSFVFRIRRNSSVDASALPTARVADNQRAESFGIQRARRLLEEKGHGNY
jgi:hypothetical protein